MLTWPCRGEHLAKQFGEGHRANELNHAVFHHIQQDYLDQVQNRTKEKRYTFDVAYDTAATNK